MSDINVPDGYGELFENGNAVYYIFEDEGSGKDNVESMRLFLETVGIPDEMIAEDDGTQVMLKHQGQTLCIDSYGLGDFYRHGYDVTVL